jgi:hypothetical protein
MTLGESNLVEGSQPICDRDFAGTFHAHSPERSGHQNDERHSRPDWSLPSKDLNADLANNRGLF